MKILHITSSLSAREGGVSAAVVGIASTQAAAGAAVQVAHTGQAENCWTEKMGNGSTATEVVHLGTGHGPNRWLPGMQARLRPLIRRADVVHVHGLWEQVQVTALRSSIRQRKPVFISPHGMLDPWSLAQSRVRKNAYLKLLLQGLLHRASSLHATAALEAGNLQHHGFGPPVRTVPLGLSRDEFESLPAAGEFYDDFPELDHRPYVLFLSRLHPKKGIDILLAAFAQSGLSREVDLVLAGPCSDPYKRELSMLIDRHRLSGSVHFTGMLYGRQRLAALVDSQLFVLPSRQENFAIAVAEAMATGTPVVVSDQVGLAHEVQDHGAGVVVSLNVDSVNTALWTMMSDQSLRTRAGQCGRALVQSSFYWDSIASKWLGIYEVGGK